MRIANRSGRLVLVEEEHCLDVEQTSDSKFVANPGAVYSRWQEFVDWAAGQDVSGGDTWSVDELGPPSPFPRQVFGIGTNYHKHAAETGWPAPPDPMVFTKFPTSITGPTGEIELSDGSVDWEVELVVVIGEGGRHITGADAWSHVAGLTGGQDLSDRDTQMLPEEKPQFSLGKSYAGFAPTGPVLVTPDEFDDVNDIEISCAVNGEEMQRESTADIIFDVATLIEYLSGIVELLPGDVIFTGTPHGVGTVMDPPRFLKAGDVLTTQLAGIGDMRHSFRARRGAA